MQGVATIFIAQISGVELSFMQIITVVVIAVVASIGTAGVPGVGLIMCDGFKCRWIESSSNWYYLRY